jgi:Holliday junction resolvase RusA-like endonuclease
VPKEAKKLAFRLPRYRSPRNHWRREINAAALAAQRKTRVTYDSWDRLVVKVRLYMPDAELAANDVDNRMKDVFDALQGRAGGPKAKRTLPAIIPNDNQIFRVEMEKAPPPKQSAGLGHVAIGRLSRGRKKPQRQART